MPVPVQFLWVITLLLLSGRAGGARILSTAPGASSSHLRNVLIVSKELAHRGHDVLLIAASTDLDTIDKTGRGAVELALYDAPVTAEHLIAEAVRWQRGGPLVATVAYVNLTNAFCNAALSNVTLMATLKAFNASMMFGDYTGPCTWAIADALDHLPRVAYQHYELPEPFFSLDASMTNWLALTPQIASELTNRMSFLERVKNVLQAHAALWFVKPRLISIYAKVRKRRGITPPFVGDSYKTAAVWIANIDFALEFPRPIGPHLKPVGPISASPAKPLSSELQTFMAGSNGDGNSSGGVVYAAMGSAWVLGNQQLRTVATVLSALPQRVLWKLSRQELGAANLTLSALALGPRVRVLEWAPQNDILGHPATAAFLTHGGVNSVYEAAYHGVPLLGIAIAADQADNLVKAQARGFGLWLPGHRLTAAVLAEKLQRVLHEEELKLSAERMARKLRSHSRTPVQQAADWVEYAIATGGEPFLRSPENDIPTHQLLLLDVYAALLGTVALALAGCGFLVLRARRLLAWCLQSRVKWQGWLSRGGAAARTRQNLQTLHTVDPKQD